jgi:hypothetical protein
MYFWLEKTMGSSLLAAIISTAVYACMLTMILLFSGLPGETFRYLQL